MMRIEEKASGFPSPAELFGFIIKPSPGFGPSQALLFLQMCSKLKNQIKPTSADCHKNPHHKPTPIFL